MTVLELLTVTLLLTATASSDSTILLVGCDGDCDIYGCTPSFSPRFNQYFTPHGWKSKSPFSDSTNNTQITGLQSAAAVYINGFYYVIGGSDRRNDAVNTVQIYDPRTNTVKLGVPLPQPRTGHTAVTYDNKIYVCGGSLDSCIMFDTTTPGGQWTHIPHPPGMGGPVTSAVINNRMYVTGGWLDLKTFVLDLSHILEGWRRVDDMPDVENRKSRPRGFLGWSPASTLLDNNKWLVCGGHQTAKSCSVYTAINDHTDRWDIWPSMNVARRNFQLVQFNSRIYAIGGYGGGEEDPESYEYVHWYYDSPITSSFLDSYEYFDATQNKWLLPQQKLAQACSDFTALVI